MFTRVSLIALLASSAAVFAAPAPDVSTLANGLSVEQINKVRSKLLQISTRSWELGAATEALLELDEPELSVFGSNPFSPSYTLSTTSPIVRIATDVVNKKPKGIRPLVKEDSVGDPASLGVSVLLTSKVYPSDRRYLEAARQQQDHLVYFVPRHSSSAISHQEKEIQLWNDFVYTAPPYLAYWGAFTHENEQAFLILAYQQVQAYRDVLRDSNSGLWKHVLLGSWSEPSLWGTGNAWAAAGATRVLQTILKSRHSSSLKTESSNLAAWATEIVAAGWKSQSPSGALYNHPERQTDDSFPESSWTAFLAATTYRLARITGNTQFIGNADRAFEYVKTQISADGLLQNVVDVTEWDRLGTQSPEGQAFVLLLQAAWRDYVAWSTSGAQALLV